MRLIGEASLAKIVLAVASILDVKVSYEPNLEISSSTSKLQLETDSSDILHEVGPIARYVAGLTSSSNLQGSTEDERAQVDKWVEIVTNSLCLLELDAVSEAPTGFQDVIELIETTVLSSTYIVGDDITLADVFVFAAFNHYTKVGVLDLVSFPSSSRWFGTIKNNPRIHSVYEPQTSCEEIRDESNPVQILLTDLGIKCTTYSHAHAYTVEEQSKYISHLSGVLTKNLFVKDKKFGMYLITVKSNRDVNLKSFANMLNLSGSNFRFGDEDLLKEKLGVERGSVSPFALMNDKENEVKFCIDKDLLSADLVNIHPLRCDRTVSIPPEALLKVLEHIGHTPITLEFSETQGNPSDGSTPSHSKSSSATTKNTSSSSAGAKESSGDSSGKGMKKETLLGLSAKKEEDFAAWYTQTITLSEMIDYSDISGCYILRPWSYFIWETIQTWFDSKIKELGVHNTYFPLFVSEKALNTEKDHVEGFAPEVAWVTKSGTSDLSEPIAIRPTSETIMYPFFAKWIRSHRDLPLEINQWCNVVRWEFKDATPFLRSREFLWQEGHTAHVSYEQAQERVLSILELYKQVYEDLLACPVIKGMKTESEKFAGGFHTTTVEAYINGSGRAIQGATSHNLGQGFGKMFKIFFEDDNGDKAIPWQTSWGLTTRTIGVCVMVHGDNKGLVLPPRVAPIQVIICPIAMKNVDYDQLIRFSESIRLALKQQGIRVDIDSRQNYTPGWKFNHWEQKGVPIRIEVGPRDMASNQCRLVRRDNGEKQDISVSGIGEVVKDLLEVIQAQLFAKAKAGRDEKLVSVTKWEDFVPALNRNCLVLTPFCDTKEWEAKVKQMSRDEALQGGVEAANTATSVAAKTLCKPFEQPPLPEGTPCFVSGLPATTWVLWGRSY